MSVQIELITSKTCPFAQRTAIMLLEKGANFTTTYITLLDKPDWFVHLSPLGKIPLLRINGQILFESAIINEYLNDIYPPSMHPGDPLQRARHRAWIEFSSELIMNLVRLTHASDEQIFVAQMQTLLDKFNRLEKEIAYAPYFNGSLFSLVDVAYAPLFIRLREFMKYCPHPLFEALPRVQVWSENLLARSSVQACLPADFSEVFLSGLQQRGKYIIQKWQLA